MKTPALIACALLAMMPPLRAEEPRALRVVSTNGVATVEPAVPERGRWAVERSTNLVDWALVYTNKVDLPASYLDTNRCAGAFYRARYTAPPVITLAPTNAVILATSRKIPQSVEISGEGPLTCEWRMQGSAVLRYGTNVVFNAAHTGGTRQYVCIVRGPGGTAIAAFDVEILN